MTDLRRIAAVMGGEVHGNTVAFPTPGHSNRDRGTVASIAPGAPDGVLVHSFNGGDPLAIKDELRAKGVLPDRERQGEAWRVTGVYEFTDESGAVLYRTRRHEHPSRPKRYTAERPDGQGGWINGLGDTQRVLYRLPELLAADPAAPVYLVEGERKADKLAAWGLPATAIAFGCKGWRKCYAEALAGRTVAILSDNDEPGRGFAETAMTAIEAAGGRAHLVELPGLPPAGDVIDWTGTADELRAITDAAVDPPAKMLPLLDLGAWEGMETPAREWVLTDWIPARQATYLTGPGSAGKSLLAQQLCTCIALGLPFLGVETRQAVAIYVTCEDDADELHRRQKAICEALGVPLRALVGKLHLVSLAGAIGNELATFDPNGRMIVADAYRTVRETATATGAGFVTLDNVAHLFAGNENIRNQVAAFCGLLNQLAHAMDDGAVLFLGHPNKAGADYSGSTAWENQVRSRLFMETPKDGDGNVLDPDARVLARGKANYARNGETLPFRWHCWAFIREDDLPKDQRAALAATIASNSENDAFLACLGARASQGEGRGVGPSPGSNYAPVQFEGMAQARGLKKEALRRAMDRLFTIGRIETYEHRNTEKGRTVTLIREVRGTPERSPERPPNTVPERPRTVHPNDPAHPPYTNVYGRGPLGAAAPDDEDIDWGDNGERDE